MVASNCDYFCYKNIEMLTTKVHYCNIIQQYFILIELLIYVRNLFYKLVMVNGPKYMQINHPPTTSGLFPLFVIAITIEYVDKPPI